MAPLLRGETVSEEPVRFRMRDGRERDCLVSARRVELDGQPAIMSVVLDVTDRRKLERRISAESAVSGVLATATTIEAALPAVLQALATELRMDVCALWIPDVDGTCIRCADVFVDDADRRLATFVDHTRASRFAPGIGLPGRVWRDRRAVWLEALLDDPNFPRVESARAAGLQSAVAYPIVSADACLGVIEIFSRASLATDAALLETLSTHGAQIGQFLLRVRSEEALRDADRRKDEFLATLAHELRNPLAPIRASLQVLRVASHDPRRVETACAVMDRQVGQMVRLIDDLLDVSRITHGQLVLKRERIALATVVESAVETLRPVLDGAEQTLVVVLPPEPVWLDGDVVRLAQTLGNLLGNASKYSPRGARIAVEARIDGQSLALCVRDPGLGIAPDMLPRIFDLFTRAETSHEPATGGLGIGLSLVKRLVEMHGGTVAAQSDGPGRGSAFTVRLPTAAPPVAVATAATGDARPASPERRRILVVDDNRDAAESLQTLLALWGHEVAVVHDGLEAVAQALAFRPDVVLLDIGLPRMNGYDACRAIRAQSGGTEAVIVAITGWGQEQDRRRSEEAGFDAHLVKPVEERALREVVARSRTAAG
jgi:signal transduction histidine kinase/CheY-like chemotaxis protein